MSTLNNYRKIEWIDTLKFLACILVMCSHFYESFFYIDAADQMCDVTKKLIGLTGGIVNGDLWVCVFCLISGFFCSKKKINSINTLLSECIIRYLRLCIPLFFVGLIIFLMSHLRLFLNGQVNEIIGNCYSLSLFYTNTIDIITFLKSVFFFGYELNAPVWMMKWLFLGNILIYVCDFLSNLIHGRYLKTIFIISVLIFCFFTNRLYTADCLLGCLIYIVYEKRVFPDSKSIKFTFFLLSFTAIVFLYTSFSDSVISFVSLRFSVDSNTLKHFIMSGVLFTAIITSPFLQKILSLKFFSRISGCSFTVYLIHWPIICSFSLLLFKILKPRASYDFSFIIILLITVFFVITVSIVYDKTLGSVVNKVLFKAKNTVSKCFGC